MANLDTQPSWDARDNAAPDAPNKRWGLFYVEDHAALEKGEKNWDKLFPYQFLILDDRGDGTYPVVNGTSGPLQFTLPIPPEALTITTPFAINGAVTLDGYVEQHGGAPLKMIALSGTTGLLPTRASTEPTGMAPALNFGKAIFAGSLQAGQALGASLAKIKGAEPVRTNVYAKDDFGDDPTKILSRSTGYYQFRLLQRFLEGYAEMKRTKAGRSYRLAFAMWKDEAVYLCTPLAFGLKRNVDSPLEYKYDLQLKAFSRISAQKTLPLADQITSTRDVNSLAKILNKVREVRATLQAGSALLRAVGADIENVVLGAIREVAFGLKDALGIAQTGLDLPNSIVRDIKTYAVAQYGDVLAATLAVKASADQASERFQDDLGILEDASNVHKVTPIPGTAHEVHDIFEHPDEHPEIMDAIDPRALVLPDSVSAKIDDERDRVREFTRRDYEQRRDSMLNAATTYANAVGAGSSTYNKTYGVNSSQVARRTPTDSDFEILFALNEAAIQMSRLAAHAATSGPKITPIEYIAGLAAQSSIQITVPRSKLAVPFLYGHTLEEMAQIYLGDTDRWFEIAALNGLREPYVDEDGFTLPLLVNARGNTVFVADASNLYLGQAVWVEGDALPRDKRHVINISAISTGLYSVVLDGDDPLDQFTLQSNARLHAFLAHTVNSQMLLYIPSDSVPGEDPRTKEVSGVDDFDHLLAVGGIDLLLTPKNDLVITPDGDGRWAYGFTNIIQQARIYLNTPKGANKRHPEVGFAIRPGSTSAEVTAQDVLAAANDTFLHDPTFSGVQAATIVRNGPQAQAVLALGIRGTSQSVPITVDVQRQ